MLNLVDNALKFTPPGGVVSVSVRREGHTAILVVRDSGMGIPADAVPHVFDRFYRVDAARSPSRDGAGLGLSLVKWIVERHEGSIAIASLLGHGSTVTVCLPATENRAPS